MCSVKCKDEKNVERMSRIISAINHSLCNAALKNGSRRFFTLFYAIYLKSYWIYYFVHYLKCLYMILYINVFK